MYFSIFIKFTSKRSKIIAVSPNNKPCNTKIYHKINHGIIATATQYEIAPDIIKVVNKKFFILSIFMCDDPSVANV